MREDKREVDSVEDVEKEASWKLQVRSLRRSETSTFHPQ